MLAECYSSLERPYSGPEIHSKIDELEDLLIESFPTVSIDEVTTHRFADGVYAREMRIPAGYLVVGKVHKRECVSVCSSGAVWVYSPESGKFQRVEAPATVVSPAGSRRVGIAERDTVWTTFHNVGDERDLEKIEAEIVEPIHELRQRRIEKKSQKMVAANTRAAVLLAELHQGGPLRAVPPGFEYEGPV